jgi:hypothetical protein
MKTLASIFAKPLLVLVCFLGGPAAADDFVFFRSPTGNINCMLVSGDWNGARCDLFQLTMSYPVRPRDCDLDWGHAFEVGATGQGGPACVGDTVADPGAVVLDYGKSLSLGGVTCTSASTGMTCTNRQGHGFTVAKARQRVF